MRRNKWDFMFDCYPPNMYQSHPGLSIQQAMEAREWWERMEKNLKKDDKKDDNKKGLAHNSMNMLSVLLLLVGTSPFVALIYKFAIIPALLK